MSQTKLRKLPHIADFALCKTAWEWHGQTVRAAYTDNVDSAVDDVVEADPVASAIHPMILS